MTLRGHFLGQKNAAKHLRICSSFDGNMAATRLCQSPLFSCYSPLLVDPKEEGSKEICLLIPVWRLNWLIFWGYEVWIFHTQGGATSVWKNLTWSVQKIIVSVLYTRCIFLFKFVLTKLHFFLWLYNIMIGFNTFLSIWAEKVGGHLKKKIRFKSVKWKHCCFSPSNICSPCYLERIFLDKSLSTRLCRTILTFMIVSMFFLLLLLLVHAFFPHNIWLW